MNEIKIDKNIKNEFDTLPKGWVFYLISGAGEFICRLFSQFEGKDEQPYCKAQEVIYQELLNFGGKIELGNLPLAIFALIHYKCYLTENSLSINIRFILGQNMFI